jgi:hypothetical protein
MLQRARTFIAVACEADSPPAWNIENERVLLTLKHRSPDTLETLNQEERSSLRIWSTGMESSVGAPIGL